MKNLIIFISFVTALISANSQANTLTVGNLYSHIPSIVNGKEATEGGGSIEQSSLDGRILDYLYCVDLFTNIYIGQRYDDTDISSNGYINKAVIANAGRVAWLLTKYGVGGQGDQAKALQAAIWNLTSGKDTSGGDVYKLNMAGNNDNIKTLYTTMLNDTSVGTISDFIWISPGKTSNNTTYQGLVTSAPVPEPATMLLFGSGIIGLAGLVRKRKKQIEC